MVEGKIDPRAHIGTVALKVSNLERSEAFYRDVVGLTVIDRGEGSLDLGERGSRLVRLEEVKGAFPRPQRSTGLYHLALLQPSRPALGKSLARLVEHKWPLHGAADHLVSEALYLDDPDRNGIEIYRDRPRNEWEFDGPFVKMANEPVDLESLLAEGMEADLSTSSESLTMGHIHLHIRDLDEAERFYCGVMGFAVMARWGPSALFVAAGGYHHHIGLNTWSGVGAPPPAQDAAGLKWFEIVLPDSSALDFVVARFKSAGASIEEKVAKVLVRDPSKNGILLTHRG